MELEPDLDGHTVRLHVVFAGRGDAMLLEQKIGNAWRVIVVDAGPLQFKVDFSDRSIGPYQLFFLSAARDVWRKTHDGVVFEPAAIINSHQHDDHLSGIVTLLENCAKKDDPNATMKLSHEFKFYMPNGQDTSTGSWSRVSKVIPSQFASVYNELVKKLGLTANYTNNDINAALPGLKHDRGELDPYALMISKIDPQPEQSIGDFYCDLARRYPKLNHNSLLLRTVPPDLSEEGTVYLTGDSAGELIIPHVRDQRLSIYKIQHHGSRIDACLSDSNDSLTADLGKEFALYASLSIYFNDFKLYEDYFVPTHIKHPLKSQPGITYLIEEVITKEYTSIADQNHLKNYHEILKTRFEAIRTYHKDRCFDDNVIQMLSQLKKPHPEGNPVASDVWTYAVEMIEKKATSKKNRENLRQGLPLDPPALDYFCQAHGRLWATEWWQKWAISTHLQPSIHTDMAKNLGYLPSIVRFFKSFSAAAYTISAATLVHRHPDPATIVGLAVGLKIQQLPKVSTLFVTSGESVRYDDLAAVCTIINEDVHQLFSTHLQIRYLKEGQYYMTISGMGDGKVPNSEDRDLNMSTEAYNIWEARWTVEARAEIYKQLEIASKSGPIRDFGDLQADNLYTLSTCKGTLFLDVDANGAPFAARAVAKLKIKTKWSGSDDLAPNVIRIISEKNQTTCDCFLGTGLKYAVSGVCWTLMWKDQIQVPQGFYRTDDPLNPGMDWYRRDPSINDDWEDTKKALEWSFVRTDLAQHTDRIAVDTLLSSQMHSISIQDTDIDANGTNGTNGELLASQSNAVSSESVVAHQNAAMAMQSAPKENDTLSDVDHLDQVDSTIVSHMDEYFEQRAVSPPGALDTTITFASVNVLVRETKFIDFYARRKGLTGTIPPITLQEALLSLLADSKQNISLVAGTWLGFGDNLLSLEIDHERSITSYTHATLGATVKETILSIPGRGKMAISVSGGQLQIDQFLMILRWTDPKTTLASFTLATEKGNLTGDSNLQLQVNAPEKPDATLAEILPAFGHDAKVLGESPVAALIGALMVHTPSLSTTLTENLPIALIQSDEFAIRADLDKSRALIFKNPNGRLSLTRADIICGLKDTAQSISKLTLIPDLSIELGDLHFTLEQLDQASPTVVVHGVAILKYGSRSINLTYSSTLQDVAESRCLKFWLSNGVSLQKLTDVLPVRSDWGSAPVPFSGKAPNGAISNLSDLSLEGVGFVVAQANGDLTSYKLTSIFAATNLDSWREYLPFDFVKAIKLPSVRVEILNPLDSKNLKVGIIVDFSVDVAPSSESPEVAHSIGVSLSALPLARYSDYSYAVRIQDPGMGVRLADIFILLGLDTAVATIQDSVPFVGNVLEKVRIRDLSVSLTKSGDRWSFGNWSLELYIEALNVIKNVLTLEALSISTSSCSSIFKCDIYGAFKLGKSDKVVDVRLMALQKDSIGYLAVESPEGISISDALQAFELPTCDDIPVLKDVIKTELNSIVFSIGLDSIYGLIGSLSLESFSLGSLKLSNLSLQFSLFTKSYLPTQQSGKEAKSFNISAHLLNGNLKAEMTWDTALQIFSAKLLPVNKATVRNILKFLLPPDLLPSSTSLVNDLELQIASLELEQKDASFVTKSFNLHLTDGSILELQSPAEQQKTKLTSLNIIYQRETTGTDLTNGKNQDVQKPSDADIKTLNQTNGSLTSQTLFQLSGIIEDSQTGVEVLVDLISKEDEKTLSATIKPKSGKALSVTGLASLFGLGEPELSKPDDYGPSLDVHLDLIHGSLQWDKVPPGQKQSARLQTLIAGAHLEGNLKIFDDPQISLEDLDAHVRYTRGASLEALLRGRVQVGETPLLIEYSRTKDGRQQFKGESRSGNQSHPLTLEDLLTSVKAGGSDYQKPASLHLPQNLNATIIGALYRPGEYVEVYAEGGAVWPDQAGNTHDMLGVNLNMASLRGSVQLSKKDGKTHKEILLQGSLSVPDIGYASSGTASLRLETGKSILLQATVQAIGETGADVAHISDKSGSENTKGKRWADIVPAGGLPLKFNNTGIKLTADLTKSKFFLTGKITDVGNAMFFTMKRAGQDSRNYILALQAADLSRLWSDFAENTTSAFNIETLSVTVVSYPTTVKQLIVDMGFEYEGDEPGGTISKNAKLTMARMPDNLQLIQGTWLFGVASFKNSKSMPMMDTLSLGMENGTQDQTKVSIAACVTRETRIYLIDIRNLKFLGGVITCNGHGSYEPATSLVKIDAELTIKELAASGLAFQIQLQFEKEKTRFWMLNSSPSGISLPDPFDNMYNIELTDLGISGEIRQSEKGPVSTYALQGGVRFGDGSTETSIVGKLYFVEGKPKVALVQYEQKDSVIGIDKIYDKILKPGSQAPDSWPDTYEILQLKTVTISYATVETQIDKVLYKAGYRISALLQIFDVDFVVSIELPKDERSGIHLMGSYGKTMDFGFLKISGKETSGISLDIETRRNHTTSYTIAARLLLFDLDPIDVSLRYDSSFEPRERKYVGTLQYNGTILNFPNPNISVYYRDGGFGFERWEIFQDIDVKKLSEAIQKGSNADGRKACGELANFAITEAVQTRFHFTLGMAKSQRKQGGEGQTASLECVTHWKYNVSVLSTTFSEDFDMGHINLTVRGPFKRDQILQTLGRLITDNLEDIGKAIIDQPDKFAMFIAVLSLEKFSREAIGRLICRGIKEKNVKERAKEHNEKDNGDIGETVKEILEIAGTTASASGIVAAITGLVEGGAALAAGYGLLATLAGGVLARKIMEHGDADDKQALENARRLAEENMKKAQARLDDVQNEIENSLRMSGDPELQIIASQDPASNSRIVNLDWSKAMPKKQDYLSNSGLSFDIRISCTDNIDDPDAVKLATSKTHCSLNPDDKYVYAERVYAWVRASVTSNAKTVSAPVWSKVSVAQKAKLRPPTAVNVIIVERNDPKWRIDVVGVDLKATYLAKLLGTSATQPEIVLLEEKFKGDSLSLAFKPYPAESTPTVDSVYASVCRIPEHSDSEHLPSPTIKSEAAVKVGRLQNLRAKTAGQQVMISYDPLAPGVALMYVIVKADSSHSAREPVKKEANVAYIDVSDIGEGEKVTLEVYPMTADPAPVYFISALTMCIQRHWAVRISPRSQLYVRETGLQSDLHLYFDLVKAADSPDLAKPKYFKVRSDPDTLFKYAFKYEDILTYEWSRFDLKMSAPYPQTLQIAATTAEDDQGPWSEPWQFPKLPQPPYSFKVFPLFRKDGKLEITWDKNWTSDKSWKGIEVIAWIFDAKYRTPRRAQDSSPEATSAVIPWGENAPKYDQIRISASPFLANVRCFPDDKTILPRFKLAWTNYLSPNLTKLGQFSSLSSLMLKQNEHLEVWWTGEDGSVQSTWLDGQLSQQVFLASSALAGGSCITAFSRQRLHQEVLWVGSNGRITGRWYNTDRWQQGTDYFFDKAGTAATTKGGVVFGFGRDSDNMDLFWVAPDLSIQTAHWQSRIGWRGPTTVAPAESVSKTDLSSLSAVSWNAENVHLCWIAADGSVRSAYSEKTTSDMKPFTPGVVAGPNSACVSGGIHLRAISAKAGAQAFWVTPDGRIATTWLQGSKDTFETAQFLTAAGSVDLQSGISSALRATEDSEKKSQLHVWWFNSSQELIAPKER